MKSNSFHSLLSNGKTLVMPCAHDALSTRLIEQAGFHACFVGGFSLVATRLGIPDVGLATFSEIYDGVRDMVPNLSIPLLVDADDGYGDVKNVTRTVQMYERLGVAGIVLEDQTNPKRCGHVSGKSVVGRDVALTKLKAALEARHDDQFFIVARTDARGPLGIDEALERASLFEEAGADALFIEAPQSLEELELIGRSFRKPLVANVAEGGRTPLLHAEQLEALGFRIICYPGVILTRMIMSIRRSLELIKAGRLDTPPDLLLFQEMTSILGMNDWITLQEKFS